MGAPEDDSDVLPLPLIAGYLDRYGIRADKIRITSRDNASDASRRETWIGLTLSAPENLAALRAARRGSRCRRPLRSRRGAWPTTSARSDGKRPPSHPTTFPGC